MGRKPFLSLPPPSFLVGKGCPGGGGADPGEDAALCHARQAAVSFASICLNNSPLALMDLAGRETGQKQAAATGTWQDDGTGVIRRQASAFYTKEKLLLPITAAVLPSLWLAGCRARGHALISHVATPDLKSPRFRPGKKVKRWPPSTDNARSQPGMRGRSNAQITVLLVGEFSQPFLRRCLWWLWG